MSRIQRQCGERPEQGKTLLIGAARKPKKPRQVNKETDAEPGAKGLRVAERLGQGTAPVCGSDT